MFGMFVFFCKWRLEATRVTVSWTEFNRSFGHRTCVLHLLKQALREHSQRTMSGEAPLSASVSGLRINLFQLKTLALLMNEGLWNVYIQAETENHEEWIQCIYSLRNTWLLKNDSYSLRLASELSRDVRCFWDNFVIQVRHNDSYNSHNSLRLGPQWSQKVAVGAYLDLRVIAHVIDQFCRQFGGQEEGRVRVAPRIGVWMMVEGY